jgi:hypothetical protein
MELDVVTGMDERLHAAPKMPDWYLAYRLDSTLHAESGVRRRHQGSTEPSPRQTPRDGPHSVLETASSRRRTLTFSASCSLTLRAFTSESPTPASISVLGGAIQSPNGL